MNDASRPPSSSGHTNFRPRRVLVTGAAGRLGHSTLELLSTEGLVVTALDRRSPRDVPADRVVIGNATDPHAVRDALDGVDAVIHTAALASPNAGSPEEVFGGNTLATFVVLQEAGEHGVRRAAIASSIAVLGLVFAGIWLEPAYVPVDEKTPLQVADPYALSKQTDEATGAMMARKYGMTVVALRFPFLGTPDRLANEAAYLRDNPKDGGPSMWAYLDVRDAARANLLAITRPLSGFHTIFAAADHTLSTTPTDELLSRYYPNVPRTAPLPGTAVGVDVGAARSALGFTARHLYHPERS